MFGFTHRKPQLDWTTRFESASVGSVHPLLKHYYSDSILPKLNTPLSECEFLAMDFETTGLNSKKDSIISVGTVPFNLQRIYLNAARQWEVKPRTKLTSDSIVIHGITHNDIADAPDFSNVIPELLETMKSKVIVVHYHPIERQFLNKALLHALKEGIEFPVIDTLELEHQIQQQIASGFLNRLRGKKVPSIRLQQSRKRYGLPTYTPHHALTDAIATAELLQAQVAKHYSESAFIEEFWI
ncbi:3'-5' exonuclease [Shewanella sp. 202IG2-18]|uniref:3'-5' exonuclease n=1 Tax=Parashewanella hymeniacidonis TaxID=2807618 RepID=UPI00195F6840|nr:3'-5' exonuclease [Parashewanella hymeniacidonis]MBM7070645.1 3'-5' exonuclease [Parashewanella hymeniacidonis]